MSLAAWQQNLQSSLRALSHWLWPPSPERRGQLQEAALTKELQRRHQRLVRLRQRLEHWRGRLEPLAREEQRQSLAVQRLVEEGKEQEAYLAALILERLRKKQARLNDRLQRGEARYQELQVRFQTVKQERKAQTGD